MDKYLDWLNAKADQAVLQFGMTKEEAITVLFKESLAEEHEGAIELMKMGDLEWIISHVTKHRS